jgi:hypothetical protein
MRWRIRPSKEKGGEPTALSRAVCAPWLYETAVFPAGGTMAEALYRCSACEEREYECRIPAVGAGTGIGSSAIRLWKAAPQRSISKDRYFVGNVKKLEFATGGIIMQLIIVLISGYVGRLNNDSY